MYELSSLLFVFPLVSLSQLFNGGNQLPALGTEIRNNPLTTSERGLRIH